MGLEPWKMAVSRPGPFAITGAWSLDADLALAAFFVLGAAWCIQESVRAETDGHVSFAVVAAVVAVTGYVPFLALRPVELSGVLALPVATWAIGWLAVGREDRVAVPWKAWVVLAGCVLAVVSSFVAYHPLSFDVTGAGGETATTRYKVFELHNAGFAATRIESIRGATVVRDDWLPPVRELPTTLGRRAGTTLALAIPGCRGTVTVTYVTLGHERTTPFKLDAC